jgi:ABC-type polar amino acid transport system ATPase subunit
MTRTGRDELLNMLAELAALQRANAERLSRVERCLSAVTAALPSLKADDRVDRDQIDAGGLERALSSEERRFLIDEATEALDPDSDSHARPRRFLDS